MPLAVDTQPRRRTFNVAINPIGAKTLVDSETFVPNHIELRNGVRTDAGFFKSRPGFDEAFDLGVSRRLNLLIPFRRSATSGFGFAVTDNGLVYELLAAAAVQQYTGVTLNGEFRPTWAAFNDGSNTIPIIVDGQAPVKIRTDLTAGNNTLEALAGSPPAGKFIAVLADRVIIAGQDEDGFAWSSAGTMETWSGGTSGSSTVTSHGESIVYMTVKDTDLWFFKDHSIEVWAHIGGNEVFGRRGIITVTDKFSVERGIAGFSVVLAGSDPGAQRFYWYGAGEFWKLEGFTPQIISRAYSREVGNIADVSEMYGFHFIHEHVIRWFEPVSGRTYVYDYVAQNFTEDNKWINGAFERMPISAYMSMTDKEYIGDYDPTGKVYEWDDDIFQDDGTNIRVFRQFRVPLTRNGHKARVNRLRLRMKRGTGAIGSDNNLEVRWAFDGVDFSNFQAKGLGEATTSIGEAGSYDPYVDIFNLGVGREILVEIVQDSPVQHLLTHAEFTVKEMGA